MSNSEKKPASIPASANTVEASKNTVETKLRAKLLKKQSNNIDLKLLETIARCN